MGVDVERGVLKPNTRICVYNKERIDIGFVESIQANHKTLTQARKDTGRYC